MTSNSKNIGRIIKEHRVTNRLTLNQLGGMSGVSSSHLARIERGERSPSAHILRKVATPLGFGESELLTFAGYLSPQPYTEAERTEMGRLDPHVAWLLSKEPIEIQRTVVEILRVLKGMTRGNVPNIGFAEYAHSRYPNLDEDIITMIEDVLEHPPKG